MSVQGIVRLVARGIMLAELAKSKMPETPAVIKTGMLYKKGRNRHNWKERFFELSGDKLSYYTGSDKRAHKGDLRFKRNGKMGDVSVHVTPHGTRKTGSSAASEWRFKVNAWDDGIMLAAPSEHDMNEWVVAIQDAVSATNPKRYSIADLQKQDSDMSMMADGDYDDDDLDGDPGGGDGDSSRITDDAFQRNTSLGDVGDLHMVMGKPATFVGARHWHHPSVRKAGLLWKRGQVNKDWRTRYFELRPGQLRYYESEERAMQASEQEQEQERASKAAAVVAAVAVAGEGGGIKTGTDPRSSFSSLSLSAAKGCLMFNDCSGEYGGTGI